jgi:hypothetical protein
VRSEVQIFSPRLTEQKAFGAQRPEPTLAKKAPTQNGHDRLDEAMALLIQNQATFLTRVSETDRRHLEFEREANERFARIEAQMEKIIRVHAEHGRMLERLPEAIRDKIGFKPQS